MSNENTWDKLLQIKTGGRDETNADEYHPYEPTPYSVLERLASSGLIGKDDVVLDYGCGKGRVGFFLSYRAKAKTIGIEYDDRIYESAPENRRATISRIKPENSKAYNRNKARNWKREYHETSSGPFYSVNA